MKPPMPAPRMVIDALVAPQQAGLVRGDDPLQLARFVWAIVHGVAMLAIDGLSHGEREDAKALMRYAADRIRSGIAAS